MIILITLGNIVVLYFPGMHVWVSYEPTRKFSLKLNERWSISLLDLSIIIVLSRRICRLLPLLRQIGEAIAHLIIEE